MSDQTAVAPESNTTPSPEAAPPAQTPTTPTTASAPAEETSLLSEAPKTEEAPAEETKAVPEPFDADKITIPAGMSKDDALFTEFTNVAKEHGLSGPAAQGLIDLYAKQIQSGAQRQHAEWAKQNEDWQKQIRANPEFGGDKLEQHLQTFSRVVSDPRFAHPELRPALALTGGGNHPAIVETFFKMAAALSEGSAVSGSPGGNGRAPETLGQAIYGRDGPHVGGPKFS